MGKTKNSKRMAAKCGKAARGMVVLPIASSSQTASEPNASTTSNAVLPPPINDATPTQQETSKQHDETAPESTPKFKLISKEQKEFLNQIQFALYTPSTNLQSFFTTIEDEHLPAAIEHLEFSHGLEHQITQRKTSKLLELTSSI
ncbi:hypothetical protein CBER1_10564 [Cercospora berteroae]|uniref:Uncharacterized protein n=1 Tax=Cercospora berteroae TaxID=357750 RepID=A0A2S6BYX6_9PEZI|nr:hypothetical protein CBER1_10564 [Cercospora berteroae]